MCIRDSDGGGFRPHVTVAKVERPSLLEPEMDLLGLGSGRAWLPIEVALYESVQDRGGRGGGQASAPRYSIVATWPLAVRPG